MIGSHDLCQDYSFWSSIENCRTDPNEMIDSNYALYPYARKCIAHEKYQYKSEKSTKDSCGKFQNDYGDIHDNCPNSKNETDCKQKEFFCEQSQSCIDKSKICDGIVHCIFGEDESIQLCKSTFPETATIQCKEIDRESYDISILATPCNGIRECSDVDDEDCDESKEALIISLVIAFVLITALCVFIHYKTTTKYPPQLSNDAEFIDDETTKYRSNLKGNQLAEIKVCQHH